VVSFMPWPLYPQGKSPSYPLGRRLGGPQSCSGHSSEEKNSQPTISKLLPIKQLLGNILIISVMFSVVPKECYESHKLSSPL
jgi:hypothetical protein